MTIIALPTANLNSTDDYIIKYDAASDDFQMEADGGAAAAYDKAKITNDAGQSVNNNTVTKAVFDANEFDVGGIANYTTGRITIVDNGYYLVTGYVTFPNIDSGEIVQCWIYKNGSAYSFGKGQCTATDRTGFALATDILSLVATDYIEFYIHHTEGAAQTTRTEAELKMRMSVVRLY